MVVSVEARAATAGPGPVAGPRSQQRWNTAWWRAASEGHIRVSGELPRPSLLPRHARCNPVTLDFIDTARLQSRVHVMANNAV